MGELARTLVSLSGPDSVHGVIPSALVHFERSGRPTGSSDEQKPEPTLSTIPDTPSVSDGITVTNATTVSASSTSNLASATDATANDSDSPDRNSAIDPRYGRTTTVPTMHARKALMTRLVLAGGRGSGFCALPGGYGTLEELMEVVTWNQLGIHDRGVCVLNVAGYWDGVLGWVRSSVEQGFVTRENGGIVVEARDAEGVVSALREYRVSGGRFRLDWGQV